MRGPRPKQPIGHIGAPARFIDVRQGLVEFRTHRRFLPPLGFLDHLESLNAVDLVFDYTGTYVVTQTG